MPSIFQEMTQAIKANILLLLVFFAVITAAELFFPGGTQRSGTSFVISTLLIYSLHRHVLFGLSGILGGDGQAGDELVTQNSFLRFAAVSAFFLVLGMLPAVFAAYK